MATIKNIKNKMKNANALGITNLAQKGVNLPETATTYDIMKSIVDIVSSGGGVQYTNITYNDDDTITLTDIDDNEHTMECIYTDGKLTSVKYDGKEIALTYYDDGQFKIGKTVTNVVNAPISASGATLNIAYGETAPEDTSKLWIKANEPVNVTVGSDILDEKTIETISVTLPMANHAMACERIGNKIYLLGGYSTPRAISVFDIETKTTRTLSVTLNNDFAGVSGWASVDKKIYLFGCYNLSYGTNIQVFDVEAETVTTINTKIPEALCAMACARVGSKIYLLGGNNKTTTINTIYEFDTETEIFTKLNCELSYAVGQVNCVSVGKKIYLLGGYSGNSPRNYIQIFNTETNAITVGQLPAAIYAMACARIGKKIYLFGGYNNGNKNTIYEFDTATNLINTLDITLPAAVRETGSLEVGNKIYLFGGAGTDALNTINCFTLTHKLPQGDIEIQSGLFNNRFNLINTENVKVETGVENVFVGSEDNEAELCEAYLHNGTEWVVII